MNLNKFYVCHNKQLKKNILCILVQLIWIIVIPNAQKPAHCFTKVGKPALI